MVTNVDLSFLTSYYQSRSGVTGSAVAASTPAKRVAPTAPWNGGVTAAQTSAAVKAALTGRKFVDEGAAKLDLTGASADYRKLFALYSGLSSLMAVTEQAGAKGLLAGDRNRLSQTFSRGLDEITSYVDDLDLDKLRVIDGDVSTSAKATIGIPKAKTEFTTPPLVSGSSANAVDAFAGNVQFNISIKRSGQTINVPIDLAALGGQTRSLVNVVDYINQQLTAAGVDARVATQRIAGTPKTTTVNGKTVTLGTNPDQYALKFKVSAGETVSFSAPATAGAVYLAQNAGNPDPDGKSTTADSTEARQFLKFQTDTTSVPPPLQKAGEANFVDGRVFAQTLGPEVKAVHDTKVGSDGSVYMLADVTSKVAGQELKGDQDVALLKYDSAGNLLFARTLGASDTASGLALALSADGKIAVAGSVTGGLTGAINGPVNSTGTNAALTDSFVTVYDGEGQELWTQRRGARQADEASNVAFGADGTVYVSGRTSSALPGSSAIGGSDSYLEGFKADAAGKVQTLFTTSFGTTGTDKPAGIVVDGTSVVTASVEDGHAVLRRFDVSGGAPVLTSTRDLGDLQGGDITGLALDGTDVVIAGSTRNGSLAVGGTALTYSGGSDAFAARISADLSPGGKIAYYGGAGDDKATALSVAGGQVWIAGSAGADLPGNPTAVGTKDAFLASLDIDAGTIDWSRRFTGKDGRAAPTSIAVDTTGASVLDRIGLPKGELDLTDSPRLTAASSVRAGDQFSLKVGSGSGAGTTITIDAKETLDTLAQKIRRASGFQAKVTITTIDGKRSLRVEPVTDRVSLTFTGKAGKDALETLGIPEGLVRKTKLVDGQTVSADGKGMAYGLGLPRNLNLNDEVERKHALAEIGAAMGIVRTAYKDLVKAASPPVAAAAAARPTGPVPQYLTNQIANYQAALQRLGG